MRLSATTTVYRDDVGGQYHLAADCPDVDGESTVALPVMFVRNSEWPLCRTCIKSELGPAAVAIRETEKRQ